LFFKFSRPGTITKIPVPEINECLIGLNLFFHLIFKNSNKSFSFDKINFLYRKSTNGCGLIFFCGNWRKRFSYLKIMSIIFHKNLPIVLCLFNAIMYIISVEWRWQSNANIIRFSTYYMTNYNSLMKKVSISF
jgi:hypothetical protein